MGDWLYLIIAIAAVGLLTLAGLLTSGRRRKEVPPPSGRTDVIAPPPTEGEAATEALVERLRTRLRVEGGQPSDVRTVLREELIELVGTDLDRRVQVTGTDGKPGVVLVVGVNGAGKTTTVGKIARILVAEDLSVTLGAADT